MENSYAVYTCNDENTKIVCSKVTKILMDTGSQRN